MAKKKSHAAAAAATGNSNHHHYHAPPTPLPAEKTAVEAPEKRDSSLERERVEQLKTLNAMLLKEAVEKRGQVAALTSRLDELSADAAALAVAERSVARAALAAPLAAAAEEAASLRSSLAAAQESLRIAEARTALEAESKREVMASLEAASVGKDRLMKLLDTKEAEVVTVSKKVSDLEEMVSELEAKHSKLCGERGELVKQLEKTEEVVRVVESQKVEMERSLQELKNKTEAYRVEMEEKVKAKVEDLEAFRAKKAELDAKVGSLEAELSAALAKKQELEDKLEGSNREIDLVRAEREKLRLEATEVEQKHRMAVVEAVRLGMELEALVKEKETAALAYAAEKTGMVSEMEGLKRKLEQIQADKETAEGAMCEKDAQAEMLRAELGKLQISMSQVQAFCNELDSKHSCLQGEKESVLKLLEFEKAEACVLRSKIEELENLNINKGNEIGELEVALEDKEAKIGVMSKELETLRLMDVAMCEKDAEAGKLNAELEKLQISMSQLQAFCDELATKQSGLQGEKDLVLKALESEKAEAGMLRLKIEELENNNGNKDGEIEQLKAVLDDKGAKLDVMSKELEELQLTVVRARRMKTGIWTWLYAATSTMVAAISFIYAARSQ